MSASFDVEWPVAGAGRDPQPAHKSCLPSGAIQPAFDLTGGELSLARAHRGRLDSALRPLGPPLKGLDTHRPFMLARVFARSYWIGHGVAPRFEPVRPVVGALCLPACGAPTS